MAGGKSSNVAGFYIPRAGASRAFVQDIRNSRGDGLDFSTTVLLHEYAHHFLIGASRFAMPRWLNEGAAEFFASSIFKDDGSVIIGGVAQHRGPELFFADPVPVEELIDPALYEKKRGKGFDAFYGKSWLLYHYLTFSKERAGQLQQYQISLAQGTAPAAAAQATFGDLDTLERELRAYLRAKLVAVALPPEKLTTGAGGLAQAARRGSGDHAVADPFATRRERRTSCRNSD